MQVELNIDSLAADHPHTRSLRTFIRHRPASLILASVLILVLVKVSVGLLPAIVHNNKSLLIQSLSIQWLRLRIIYPKNGSIHKIQGTFH
jgi:hypothetical protein